MKIVHARLRGGQFRRARRLALLGVGTLLLASITTSGATALPAESPAASDPNNFAPASRTLKPVAVHQTIGTVAEPGNLVTGGAARLSGNGSYVVLDFGKEVGGLVSLRFAGVSGVGRQVGLAFSETAAYVGTNSDRSSQHQREDGAIYASVDAAGAYTMPKEKLRGGFRYLTLFLASDGWVDVNDVTLKFTPDPDRANLRDYPNYFRSNDDLLNKLWYAGAYTVQTNTIAPDTGRTADAPNPGWKNAAVIGPGTSVLTDGAKRDRTVWPGDLGVALPTAYASLNDTKSSRNALEALYGLQGADGMLPYAGPEIGQPGKVDTYASDTYHLWTLVGTGLYHRYTDDTAWVRSVWPKYTNAMHYSLGKIDGTGLLNVTKVADWGQAAGGGRKLSANALLYGALTSGVKLADALGDTARATAWRQRAAAVKAEANTRLWNPATGLYRDTPDSDLHPQGGNSLAVWLGLTDGVAKDSSVARTLTGNWSAIGAVTPEYPGVIGTFTGSLELVAQLVANNDTAALALMRREWGHMLNSPNGTNSTFWESFHFDGAPYYGSYMSAAHGWSSGPTNALTFFVLGLNPSDATRYDFVPHLGDLTHVEGNITTPKGAVKGSWDYTPGTFTSTLTAPAGTTGRIGIPTYGSPSVKVMVNGATVWSDGKFQPGAGLSGGSSDGGYIYLTGAGGGSYTVTATGVVRTEKFDIAVPSGQLPPGYTFCASEGQTCTPNGSQVVAFGAGSHEYRVVSGPVTCEVASFAKDPTPGVFKYCYLAPAGGPAGAVKCASENDVCRVDGRRAIAYGTNGAFRFMTVNDTVPCTTAAFGSDPLQGTTKSCYVLPEAPAGAWEKCADEGARCAAAGLQAFGTKGSYWTAKSDGTAKCELGTFGTDPLYGVVKSCFIWAGTPAGFTRECAAENGTCSFSGTQTVAFGRNGSYVYKTFTGPTSCVEGAFGTDPVYGVVKSCYLVS
ncbi:alpha-L-rhamnosidase [Lentzea albidocapillata subsp. violacea]|uniref:Alpha-L-rhamnosidase n=1 Tax=Lentzea albidocapillata subsp. violacea TaxID=128104 RepID=A0A1G8QH00_9PSEU|nr:alpha-L-rhamnosidase C-terminal domain-containing protein [Lentzea albidocapillata]SDJ04079.1 alpha-L-rhamnosidase [Lentzea albidocapillata subsp. violacea]